MQKTREQQLRSYIGIQRTWIETHGATLAGYIERYGSKDDAHHYGDGGEAIYAADTKALAKLEAELEKVTGQVSPARVTVSGPYFVTGLQPAPIIPQEA